MVRWLGLTLIILMTTGCLPGSNNSVDCGLNYSYNPVTRSCDQAINQVTDPSLGSITMQEDASPTYVELTYSDVEDDIGVSCSILYYTDGIDDYPPSSCSCNASGVCSTYITPDADFHGTAQFSYNIVDQDGTSKSKAVYVVVESVNDNPVATSSSFSIAEQSEYFGDLSSLVSDIDSGDILTYSLLAQPSNGVVDSFSSSTGSYRFTPLDDDTTHSDDSSSFTYKVCDSDGGCATNYITVTVTSTNNAPVLASSQSVTVIEGETKAFDLNEATDMESDTITYTIVNSPSEGTLTCTGISCSYDPTDDDFVGNDSFSYKACDDYGPSCSTTANVTLVITAENDPPVPGADQNLSVDEDESGFTFTLNPASDVEAGGVDSSYALSYELVTAPTHGVISGCVLASTPVTGGECTYTPNNNYDGDDGDDVFTYKVNDYDKDSESVATITVAFTAVNDAPVISDISRLVVSEAGSETTDAFTIDEGGGDYEEDDSITISVTSSDSTIVDPANIDIYYDLDDDGELDAGELLGDGSAARMLSDLYAADSSEGSETHNFYLKVSSTLGNRGLATISVTATDDGGGSSDSDDIEFEVYVPELTAVHGGWKHVSAVGIKVDRYGNEMSSNNTIHLEWHSFSMNGTGEASDATITGWNIFRRETGGEYDLTDPLNGDTPISSTTLYYTDEDVVANKVYYYKVYPVATYDSYSFNVPTAEPHSEIRILSPPNNMAFVHRWMVNQEVCDKMHMNIESDDEDMELDSNYRCPYSGPGDDVDRDGSSDGYYDMGYDMLVDISEAGCPYTSAANAPECGANGCVGIGTPTANLITPASLPAGEIVYYDRETGKCYQSTGLVDENDWEEMSGAASFDATAVADESANTLYPPLVQISQASAYQVCQTRTALAASGIDGIDNDLSFTLPRRKEQIGYSAWDEITSSGYTDAEIRELEDGESIDTSSKCNSASADGLATGYTSVDAPASPFAYAITGTDYSNIRSVYTGSEALGGYALTPTCVSRYGIQDHAGNVSEWLQDRIRCISAPSYTCSALAMIDGSNNDFDVSDTLFDAYALDGRTGPCDDSSSCGDALEGWYFDDDSNSNQANRLIIPLALPVMTTFETIYSVSGVVDYIFRIGDNSGITDEQMHDDYFGVNADDLIAAGGNGGMTAGGSYLSGDKAGRYTVDFQATGAKDIGFRCIIPVYDSDYTADPEHTYSY